MADSTSRSLRRRNRARVLRSIVLARETTRAALAADCELSTATVTNVVGDLIAEGVVEEVGSVPSDGGRPIARIAMRASGGHLVGVDVGERGVAIELFDLTMTRVDREFREGPTREAGPAEIAAMLREGTAALRGRNPGPDATLIGIGLGLPGIVEHDDARGGQVLHAQSLGWPPVAVRELVGDPGVPVLADNGAKTLAEAELWFGAARGARHALVVLLGRGVGLGVVSDGRLLRGARGSAWEWGHTRMSVGDGPLCRCGARGCLEAYVGAHAVLERWRAAGATETGEGWRAVSALVDAADAGDPVASRVLDETLDVLGIALGNLVDLTNPERVVVGGWVGLRLMATRRADLVARIGASSLARPGGQFTLDLCRFEGDSVALGAALLPLQAFIERPMTVSGAA